MKNVVFASLILLMAGYSFGQSAVGTWKTIDDETGNEKSYVEISERDGKLYGTVVKILTPGKENAVCEKCKGDKKDMPIVGMEILSDVEKDGNNSWDDGSILDPNEGKVYDVSLELIESNKLKVRGYIGFSLLGRTQYWSRVE